MSAGFISKATDDEGRVAWITPANANGFRALSSQSEAATFSTCDQAQLAIDALPPAYRAFGMAFAIEPAE